MITQLCFITKIDTFHALLFDLGIVIVHGTRRFNVAERFQDNLLKRQAFFAASQPHRKDIRERYHINSVRNLLFNEGQISPGRRNVKEIDFDDRKDDRNTR